jgi:hypothetical protein
MSKFRSFIGSKTELWRAVDAHNGRDLKAQNGGFNAQNESLYGSVDQWSLIRITLTRSKIRIRFKVISWFRIRFFNGTISYIQEV